MSDTHPLYPDRTTINVTIRGNTMAGWFSGEAAIWTGGADPKIVGPFEGVREAMLWQADNAPGSQIFPYYPPVKEAAAEAVLDPRLQAQQEQVEGA
jgi:hypothetical protein